MKKTATTITAAMFAMTALSAPARADDTAIRLGIGIVGALIGEAVKNGGNRHSGGRQPSRGDTLIGRVDGKPVRGQEPRQTAKKRQADQSDEVAYARFIPQAVPTPEAKPTADEMAAWVAAAPERAEQDAQAEIEIAADLAPTADPTTTAATTPAEEATVELRDGNGESWGKVTPTRAAKAQEFARLGMGLADSYRAVGLSGPMALYPEWDGKREVRDEDGRVWGRVRTDVADRIAQAVTMGMKPSQAIPAITQLESPDVVAAKAKAEADAEQARAEKVKAYCIDKGDMASRWTECQPYEAEVAAALATAKAKHDADAAQCVAERTNGITKDDPSSMCSSLDSDVTAAIAKAKADKEAVFANTVRKGLEDGFAEDAAKDAEKTAMFTANSAENAAPAPTIVEAEKPAVDDGQTAAIEAKPKLDVDLDPPAEKPAEKAKPKLDVDL